MEQKLVPQSHFGRALQNGGLSLGDEDVKRTYDIFDSKADARVMQAHKAVAAEEDLVVDLARVGGLLADKFAIAPIRYCGKVLTRRRDVRDGEVYFRVGRRWSMHFEPGVVMGYTGSSDSRRGTWRDSHAQIPPVPAEYRPERAAGHFVVWEQEWTEKVLFPRDPALLEHVIGDVYVVRATWDLTPLEAAALRGTR